MAGDQGTDSGLAAMSPYPRATPRLPAFLSRTAPQGGLFQGLFQGCTQCDSGSTTTNSNRTNRGGSTRDSNMACSRARYVEYSVSLCCAHWWHLQEQQIKQDGWLSSTNRASAFMSKFYGNACRRKKFSVIYFGWHANLGCCISYRLGECTAGSPQNFGMLGPRSLGMEIVHDLLKHAHSIYVLTYRLWTV